MGIRVLVCGGRDYKDLAYMRKVLRDMFDPDDTVTLIHGDAKGADRLSEEALKGYFHGGFEVKKFPVTKEDWRRYGLTAGPLRNKQMIDEGQPNMVIAFPGGNGTADMVRQAKKAGITTLVFP